MESHSAQPSAHSLSSALPGGWLLLLFGMQGKYPELRLVVQASSGHKLGLFAFGCPQRGLCPKTSCSRCGVGAQPHFILLPPRAPPTVAALPGVVSHPRIRQPPPPALQGIHISQVGRGHRTGSGVCSPEFCPYLTGEEITFISPTPQKQTNLFSTCHSEQLIAILSDFCLFLFVFPPLISFLEPGETRCLDSGPVSRRMPRCWLVRSWNRNILTGVAVTRSSVIPE